VVRPLVGCRGQKTALADLSGAIGVDASSELLNQLTEEDEARAKDELREGRKIIARAEERLCKAGVSEIVSLKRRGTLVDTICELESDIEIIVLGKLGKYSDEHVTRAVSNAEQVARAVQRPLMITSRDFKAPKRFLIAFDGGRSSNKALEYVIGSPLLKEVECHIVSVGSDGDGSTKSLDLAAAKLGAAGFDMHSSLLSGQPDMAIQAYVDSNNIDLLVIGAYGHSRIRSLILGSTTTSIITSCKIPLLLFR